MLQDKKKIENEKCGDMMVMAARGVVVFGLESVPMARTCELIRLTGRADLVFEPSCPAPCSSGHDYILCLWRLAVNFSVEIRFKLSQSGQECARRVWRNCSLMP